MNIPNTKKFFSAQIFLNVQITPFGTLLVLPREMKLFLHILHVNANMASQSYFEGKVETDYPELAESIRKTAIKDLGDELQERYEKKIKTENVPFEIVITEGQPYHEIIKFAREKNVDIIVIGTRGKTGIKHAFLGSVAEMTTRLSAVPVFSIPCEKKNWPDVMY